jgi:hypothetical protein
MSLTQIGYPVHNSQAIRFFQESAHLDVDGVYGPLTDAAFKKVLANGGKISPHFKLTEFACPHCHWPRAHWTLLRGLESLRTKYYPSGLTIVSGYRCTQHNSDIGGAPGSWHIQGRAADIPPLVSVDSVKAMGLFSGLEYQPKISGRRCTHVDTRTSFTAANPSIFAW